MWPGSAERCRPYLRAVKDAEASHLAFGEDRYQDVAADCRYGETVGRAVVGPCYSVGGQRSHEDADERGADYHGRYQRQP